MELYVLKYYQENSEKVIVLVVLGIECTLRFRKYVGFVNLKTIEALEQISWKAGGIER